MIDSDGETGSDALNSSKSQSSTSSCSSLSRLSFDASAAPPPPPDAPARRPHRSSDPAWAAIRRSAHLGPRDFRLLRRIGSGDTGTVYLCRLRSDPSDHHVYAMKVVDRRVLAEKKKLGRAETERRVLRLLDHPFLPTLYADFDASAHHSCVVMEYCSGGDLHSLLHRQPRRRFHLPAARFYAAEVLLALEYLHLLGIVYRDLKPENALIRSDGHIMLSDFDLSLESVSSATVERGRLVAEPTAARSRSFVGTHEYVAPEVAAGRAHGSGVDWWAYGVFLYEMLYGRTPFAGPTNEATLRNVVAAPLGFPRPAPARGSPESAARELIAVLLVKDPDNRLGSRGGAADVKSHAFFKGVNFALMRTCRPPVVPGTGVVRAASSREPDRPNLFNCF